VLKISTGAIEMSKKTVVAWVSRHDPLRVQEEVLKEKLGTDIEMVRMSNTYKNASVIIELLKKSGAKYAVVVLPLSVIKHLLNTPDRNGIVFLKAEMKPATGEYNPGTDVLLEDNPGMKRHVRFSGYRIITAIQELTEPFEVKEKVKVSS